MRTIHRRVSQWRRWGTRRCSACNCLQWSVTGASAQCRRPAASPPKSSCRGACSEASCSCQSPQPRLRCPPAPDGAESTTPDPTRPPIPLHPFHSSLSFHQQVAVLAQGVLRNARRFWVQRRRGVVVIEQQAQTVLVPGKSSGIQTFVEMPLPCRPSRRACLASTKPRDAELPRQGAGL